MSAHIYFIDEQRHVTESAFVTGREVALRSKRGRLDLYDVVLEKDDRTGETINPNEPIPLTDKPLHFLTQPKARPA